MEWSRLCNFIVKCLLLIALAGTYKRSCYLGPDAIFVFCNPAFGGRGPGLQRRAHRKNTRLQLEFDSTRGFPGEGWSVKFPLLKIATWNCRSLTFERYNYCRTLGYDVLALTELWHNQSKFQTKDKSFIISEPKLVKKGKRKGQVRFPEDRAAGVAIMLSKRATEKVKDFGSEGERVCYVRLKGPVTNIFVIAVYVPHRGRASPCQDDTLHDLENVLRRVPTGDCVCILGDFNEQLEGGVKDRTGKWVGGLKSKNAEKIMQLLRLHELTAVNTLFQPRHGKEVHTYLQTAPQQGGTGRDTADAADNSASSDFGEYVGSLCKTTYKGRQIGGRVKAVYGGTTKKKWVIKFDDGLVLRCGPKTLSKLLVTKKKKQIGKQLDYILVSTRWKSCVRKCEPKWGPSMHRNVHGQKGDHALLACTWKWRLRTEKKKPVKDFSCLGQGPDESGQQPTTLRDFDVAVQSKLEQLSYDAETDNATDMYDKMCEAIHFAVETVLPTVTKTNGVHRKVSARTKALFEKRTEMTGTKAQYAQVQKQIKESSMQDFKDWVSEWADTMQAANSVGDTHKVYEGVKALRGKREAPQCNLSTNAQGAPLDDAVAIAEAWESFLKNKFAATDKERQRPDMANLPPTIGTDKLTDKEVLKGLQRMKYGKARGPDEIPVIVYKQSTICKDLLVKLLQKIWDTEEIPVKFARATFVMLYKQKGSKNDPSKYRCIGLLNHCYKILSQCLLERLNAETDGYLADWQAGFRKQRGCRDNVMVLRTLIEDMLEKGEQLVATFVDYSAAFDSVSHKFIDLALADAGASAKSRAMFRAIYQAASATTRVPDTDGEYVQSNPFPIHRGVVQGDITSPLYFVLALQLILKRHDNVRGKGVPFADGIAHTLAYADDAALLDGDTDTATLRVTAIAKGSAEDADMAINVDKTEVVHFCEQGRVPTATRADMTGICKHVCQHVGCKKVFFNMHGLKCHQGKCKWGQWHIVDRILDTRWTKRKREFKVRWEGYSEDHDTWEPRENLTPAAINEFLIANGLYDHDNTTRCPHCDRPFKSAHGVKIHLKACQLKNWEASQDFTGRLAEARAAEKKMEEAQAQLPQVECAGDELVNAFYFKYLGSIFAADGDHKYDVRRRIGIAMTRMGQLRHVFSSKLPRSLKLKVYKAAICSLFTYGSEAWNLDEQTCAALNGANSRCLSRFTGRTIHEEASPRTRTFDLVAAIRQTRARWLGHILRMGPERMLHQAALQQFKNGSAGNLFMDVPAHLSLDRIKTIAQDRAMWKKLMVYSIRHHVSPPRQDATRQHSGASSTTNMTTRSASRAITSARPNRSTTTPTPGHETSLTPAVKPMRLAQAKVKRKKKKPKGLTDKQRAVEAHAHYIIHHSTAADAARFLRNNGNIKNASIETITALRQMCPTTPAVPTWEAADAAVFSSSSDESADMNSGESHAAVAAIAPVWSESAAAPDTVQATHDMHRRLQRLDGSESKLTSAAAVSTVPTWGQTIAIATHNDNNDSQHDDVEMRTPAHNADDKHMPLTAETKLEKIET